MWPLTDIREPSTNLSLNYWNIKQNKISRGLQVNILCRRGSADKIVWEPLVYTNTKIEVNSHFCMQHAEHKKRKKQHWRQHQWWKRCLRGLWEPSLISTYTPAVWAARDPRGVSVSAPACLWGYGICCWEGASVTDR